MDEGVVEVHGEGDRVKMASGSSQRPQQGIGEMRQMVNRLFRRIHYSAFVCPNQCRIQLSHRDRFYISGHVVLLGVIK